MIAHYLATTPGVQGVRRGVIACAGHALEDGTLFFEAKAGPYVPLAPDEKASFAPPEGDPRVPEYLAWLQSLCAAR